MCDAAFVALPEASAPGVLSLIRRGASATGGPRPTRQQAGGAVADSTVLFSCRNESDSTWQERVSLTNRQCMPSLPLSNRGTRAAKRPFLPPKTVAVHRNRSFYRNVAARREWVSPECSVRGRR